MTIEVKVEKHSKYKQYPELVTMVLKYPRYIHSELLTHRMFSRNSSSSRATPVKTLLNNIKKDPATPIVWGSNKSGMQAGEELTGWRLAVAKFTWFLACRFAVFFSGILHAVGLHKQHANRITEPYQHINTLVTATEWENFFKLRNHPDAQPEIQALAKAMQKAINRSEPEVLKYGQWHLPFITEEEHSKYCLADLKKASAARCARIAYARHGSPAVDLSNDISLYTRLAGSDPKHLSPLEHVALPSKTSKNNFRYWKQLRQEVE